MNQPKPLTASQNFRDWLRPLPGPPILLTVHSNQSRPSFIIQDPHWTSQSLADHSIWPGLTQGPTALSMPIMTYLNNIILIPATPSIRPNIWTTQSLPEPYWSTKSIRGLPSSNSVPSPIKPILASPYKLHPLQTITHHSRSHWTQSLSDHSKQPGHSPGPPALFQANQELSWPLCTYPTHSKPSTPSPITQDPSWTIQIRPGFCWSIKSTTRPPTLFQVHLKLSWIFLSTTATSDHSFHHHYSRIMLDQSKPPRPFQMTKTYSKIISIDDCSKSTTTSPGNFILIPATPDHHRHHPD